MDQDVAGIDVSVSPHYFMLDGDPARWGPSSPPQKRGDAPTQFSAISIVAKRLDDQDATWYGGRPQPRRLCPMGTALPLPPKTGGTPQTAGWIKMVVGMEVGRSSGDFMLDGD